MSLDAIFQWKMTPQEIEAMNLALCYEAEFKRLFGDSADGQAFRRNSLKKVGDPRKSNLFRHCWKLLRETRGLLESHEYKNYIRANLTILKLHNATVEPNSICGDKAWIRYKVWKRRYDEKMSEIGAAAPTPSVSSIDPKIIREIDKTKKFLFERCEGTPSADKIANFVTNGFFKFWVATGKVSTYYVALSPFIAKATDLEALAATCSFSLVLVRERLTPEVKEYFKHEFRHEHG